MSHIFISYSRKDLGFAQKLVDALLLQAVCPHLPIEAEITITPTP